MKKKDQEIRRIKDLLADKEQSNDGEEDDEKYYKTDIDEDEEEVDVNENNEL